MNATLSPSATRKPPSAPQTNAASRVLEVRLLFAAVFGLIGIALWAISCFMSAEETKTFGTFLTGQIPWGGALGSVLFWKLFAGFLAGATAGALLSYEIPESELHKGIAISRGVALFVIAVALYIPAMNAGYLWDDDQEITANPSLRTPYGLWEIWTGGITNDPKPETKDPLLLKMLRPPLRAIEEKIWGDTWSKLGRPDAHESPDYFPLKSTMLWLEYRLWGLNASGYHVVNILLHALNGVLLWRLLKRLKVPGAWFGALLFAIHPAHVESVAWIAERKNTLSLLFYLLAIRSWLVFEETGRRRSYAASLAHFAAAALCKTSVVMLPVVLMLLTWWRTGRLPGLAFLASLPNFKRGRLDWRDITRYVPFFALALGLSLVTIWFQNGRAIGDEVIPIGNFWSRLAGAGLAAWWYLGKAFLPINLTTIYPRFPIDPPQPLQFVAGALILALAWVLWAKRERLGRAPLFVLGYFLVTLFPVLGFFKMSYMRLTLVADHFQYLSDISVVAFVGAIGAGLLERARVTALRPVVIGLAFAVAIVFFAYGWTRVAVHYSMKTLWTDALKMNEASWQANNHYGAILYNEAQESRNQKTFAEAMKHFKRAVDLKPDNPEVHNNYGLALAYFGRWDEALVEYKEAVRIKGEVSAIRRNYILALMTTNRIDEALEQARLLVKGDPLDPNGYLVVAQILAQVGRPEEAVQQVETGLQADPNHAGLRQFLLELRRPRD